MFVRRAARGEADLVPGVGGVGAVVDEALVLVDVAAVVVAGDELRARRVSQVHDVQIAAAGLQVGFPPVPVVPTR